MKNTLITVLFFTSNMVYAGNISIKAPSIAENGSVIPVTVIANNPINPGDILVIKGDEKVALKLSTDSNPIKEVSTRVRLKKSGNVSVSIARSDGSIDAAQKRVKVTVGASIKQSSSGSEKYVKRIKKGVVKLLFRNVMAADKYIKQVNLSTNHGMIKMQMTPILSEKPYLKIVGKYKIKTASIGIILNSGSKYTDAAGANDYTPKTLKNKEKWSWGNSWWESATVSEVKNKLDGGADIYDSYDKNSPVCHNHIGMTPLMHAAQESTPDVVKLLIDSGARVNHIAKDSAYKIRNCSNDDTALSLAATYNKSPDVINVLINAGAEVKTRHGYFQNTPLSKAVSNNNLQVVKALINAGADITTKDSQGESLAFEVMSNEDVDVVQYVLGKVKEDVDLLLLKAAQWNDNPKVIKLLLNMGANVNTMDDKGHTILMLASDNKNNSKVIKEILKHNKDLINNKDTQGNTALMYASGWGGSSSEELSVENVKTLLSYGADISISNDAGYSPLDAANAYHNDGNLGGKQNSKLEKLLKESMDKKGLFDLFKKDNPTAKDVVNAVKEKSNIYSTCKIKRGADFNKSVAIRLMKKGKYNKEKNYHPYKIIIGCRNNHGERIREVLPIKVFYSEDFSEWTAEKIN